MKAINFIANTCYWFFLTMGMLISMGSLAAFSVKQEHPVFYLIVMMMGFLVMGIAELFNWEVVND